MKQSMYGIVEPSGNQALGLCVRTSVDLIFRPSLETSTSRTAYRIGERFT
ncbi:hypothetical protein ACFS5L_33705 [Streptomyces phyllanthi]|nr:hypothetical protein [Streptomyces phyllanthi]